MVLRSIARSPNIGYKLCVLGLALALSMLGLVAGPALVALGRGRAAPSAAIEGLMLGLVPVLVLVRLTPHAYESIGPAALGLVALGYTGTWLADRWGHRAGARIGRALIVPALTVHAFTDGAALAVAFASDRGGHHGTLLGAALLLHRFPEGLFLATALVPVLGWRRTLWRLVPVATATILGAGVGHTVLAHVSDALLDAIVALGLGVILRLVMHDHSCRFGTCASRAIGGVAFLMGLAGALAVPTSHNVLERAQPQELSVVQSLGPLFVETAPSMVMGLLAAGIVQAFLPRKTVSWLQVNSSMQQAIRGVVWGMQSPACTCKTLPLAQRLLRSNAPVMAVVSFVVAMPGLGVDSVVLSLRLLGGPMTFARIVLSAAIALLSAYAVATVMQSSGMLDGPDTYAIEPAHTDSVWTRIQSALRVGFGPTLDHRAAWYLFGLSVAAAFEAALPPGFASRIGTPHDVVIAALFAVPLYLGALGAIPLAAVMVHKGFSLGAALAFLIVGPTIDARLLTMVRHALGWRAAALLAGSVVGGAITAGWSVNAWLRPHSVPGIHPMAMHQHHSVEWACAVFLGAMLIASLLRVGPRAWLETIGIHSAESFHQKGRVLQPGSFWCSRTERGW